MYYLEIQGLFKDFCHNSRTFQGFMQIQGLFKTSSQIQGLFKTLAVKFKGFSISYEPCEGFYGFVPQSGGSFKNVTSTETSYKSNKGAWEREGGGGRGRGVLFTIQGCLFYLGKGRCS